jgi:hypothetical protein
MGCVSVKSAGVQLLKRAILSAKSARETQRLSALGDLPVSHSTFNIGRPCSPPHPCWLLLLAENTIKEKRLGCVSHPISLAFPFIRPNQRENQNLPEAQKPCKGGD